MSLRAFTMPKWGIEMAEGVITEWHVAEGQSFDKGDLLAAVETDKIVNEIEAEFSATCLRRLADSGESYSVGALLAVMGPDGTPADQVSAFIDEFVPAEVMDVASQDESAQEPAAEPAGAGDAATPTPGDATGEAAYTPNTDRPLSPAALALARQHRADLAGLAVGSGQIQKQDVQRLLASAPQRSTTPVDNQVDFGNWAEVNATPVARQAAAQRGLSADGIAGSGAGGRIRLSDLNLTPAAVVEPQADDGFEPYSPVRRRIAQRMTEAAALPHFYLETSFDASALMAERKRMAEVGQKVSVNDFLVLAVARSLLAVPQINVHVSPSGVCRFNQAHVAIAVARDDGLVTPVIRSAQSLSPLQIGAESKRLAVGARDNQLGPDDYAGGTFTISNLGMFGIERFTALLNPPQAAILAVGATRRLPAERDGQVVFEDRIALTLGCDHRAVDGALGARFLDDLKRRLEAVGDTAS